MKMKPEKEKGISFKELIRIKEKTLKEVDFEEDTPRQIISYFINEVYELGNWKEF